MRPRLIALDPGTANTGYAVFNFDRYPERELILLDKGVLHSAKEKGGSSEVRERIDVLGQEVRQLIHHYATPYLVIEDFTEQGKLVGKTYKEMSWMTEHLRMIGREENLSVDVYENAYWKKELIGARRLTKEQVRHFITHKFPWISEQLRGQPDHVWDAAAIGLCKIKLLHQTGEI